jgi:hypothetical protein
LLVSLEYKSMLSEQNTGPMIFLTFRAHQTPTVTS